MQACILRYFPTVQVTYTYTNRTPQFKFSRSAFDWLQLQIDRLDQIKLSSDEESWLRKTCRYLPEAYLQYLKGFKLQPHKHIKLTFNPQVNTNGETDVGDINLHTEGLWIETILYEIPLLALTSETYFRFMDTDWTHDNQHQRALNKGQQLLREGCIFSEFGTRRRRDYHTQELVLRGLVKSAEEGKQKSWLGKLAGTSNVHFAMRFDLQPVGTVAHEWFMGVAAVTNNYRDANEIALQYWVATFGEGVLGIALTDTFGTDTFLKAFRKSIPAFTSAKVGADATSPSAGTSSTASTTDSLAETKPPLSAPVHTDDKEGSKAKTYAEVFTGVRQDSGDPLTFVQTIRRFYDAEGIKDKKTIVFSDSLNVELCLKYKKGCEEAGIAPTFGIGTFLTNDYNHASDEHEKSLPLNIVIKLSSANGNPAVKISDNIGKNTGDKQKVQEVKNILGYSEKTWTEGDEASRWGKDEQK